MRAPNGRRQGIERGYTAPWDTVVVQRGLVGKDTNVPDHTDSAPPNPSMSGWDMFSTIAATRSHGRSARYTYDRDTLIRISIAGLYAVALGDPRPSRQAEAPQYLLKPRVVPNGSEVWSHADKGSVVIAGWALVRCFLEVVEYPSVIVDPHAGKGNVRPTRYAVYHALLQIGDRILELGAGRPARPKA